MAVEAQVATAMAGYLFTHPDVNAVMTSTEGMTQAERRSAVQSYLAANPQTKAEIDAIRGPGADLRARCNIPASDIHYGLI
jgi:hemophore-related protein